MGYGCSNLTEESLLGCLGELSSEDGGERKPETYQCLSARPEPPDSSFPEGYAADCDAPRRKFEACFSILLTRENPFKVIPKRKDHDAH